MIFNVLMHHTFSGWPTVEPSLCSALPTEFSSNSHSAVTVSTKSSLTTRLLPGIIP